jgi:hypothetical protein
VYFTEFDRVTYSQVAWSDADVEGIKRNLERKLKLLALVKGHVVIAASHLLESELAREVIAPHPELLSKRIVVPALRSEFPTCTAFMESKRETAASSEADLYAGNEQQEMAALIDQNALVVEWDVDATAGWFQDRLVADLSNGRSLVGLRLRRLGFDPPESLIASLAETPMLSRGSVYKLTEPLELRLRETISDYADFLYYLSGARAVNSEGVLPQENLLDFRVDDLAAGATSLSEHEIFFKLFVDIVKSATSTTFPTNLLDALSMSDAIDLHGVAINDHFVEKYHSIQEKTKDGLTISDPERLILSMEEIATFEHELQREFTAAIDAELPARLRSQRIDAVAHLLHAVASILILPYAAVTGAKDILVSGLRFGGRPTVGASINRSIQQRVDAFERLFFTRRTDDRDVLLSFTEKLKKRYADTMFF